MNRIDIDPTIYDSTSDEEHNSEMFSHDELAEIANLYNDSYKMMYNVAFRAGANEPDAIVQIAWEKALKKWNTYANIGSSRQAWLGTIVRHAAMDEYRRRKAQGNYIHINPSSDENEYLEFPDSSDDYETLASNDAISRPLGRVAALLETKPDSWREIFKLRLAGYTNTEIGEELGMNRATVGTAIMRMNKHFTQDEELMKLLNQ